MSEDGFHWSGAGFDTAVQEADALEKQILSLIEDLNTNAQSHLQGWVDEAKEVYGQRQTQWNSAAAPMPTTLAQAKRTLGDIAEMYGLGTKQAMQIMGGS
jgi:uncharacterized protein YukE